MTKENPQLDSFFQKASKWQEEMSCLRNIVLDCELEEQRKWHQPVYSINGKNVAIISSFKDYCVLSFFKGVLLKDVHGLLSSHGENSQSVRTIRFTATEDIIQMQSLIKAYLMEAIANEKAGLKVKLKTIEERAIPEELSKAFKEMPELQTAFRALTPGRQRAYLLHFAGAKQSLTRTARIEKQMPRILAGKGLND